ncbi:bifunctional folylpolyglutamate synthase/dihydrofolate synthase [Agathobacter sp.]
MGNLDYEQILNKIENTRRFGNEPGVTVTKQVIKVLKEKGKLKRDISFIHVAGTNGKGSVCAFLTSILKENDYKVGTFVSPHLIDFEERIMVSGQMISKADVTRLGNYLVDIDFGIGLTMFDYCLAMALLYFEEQQCGYMVIETGLGGRLDSTNAIGVPVAEVIAKIGYDHMSILGSDIAGIAAEKAGIIKPDTTVVVEKQEPRAMEVIEKVAKEQHANVIHVEDSDIERCSHYDLKLCGKYQWENAAAAELTAGYLLNDIVCGHERSASQNREESPAENAAVNIADRIRKGLERATWPGRMELLSTEPFLMADGAHNSNGVEALKESLMQMYPGEKFRFFMGVMADKDYDVMVREILPLATEFFTVTPESSRALQASNLAEFVRNEGVKATELSDERQIVEHLSKDTKNIAFGSLYFIGELKKNYKGAFDEKYS